MELLVGRTIALLGVAMAVAILARRLRLPYTVGLVLTGVGLAVLRVDFGLELTHDVIFDLILPPLLFEAALTLSWKELQADWAPVLAISGFGVALCAGVVALWFLALRSFRFADLSSTTAWLLVAATLGAPWLARRLVDWSRRGSPTWPSLRQAINDELLIEDG